MHARDSFALVLTEHSKHVSLRRTSGIKRWGWGENESTSFTICDKQTLPRTDFCLESDKCWRESRCYLRDLVSSLLCYDSLHLLLSCLHCPLSSATQKQSCVWTPPPAEGHNTARKTSVFSAHSACLAGEAIGFFMDAIQCCVLYSAVGARNLIMTTSFPFCLLSLAAEGSQPSVGSP